MKLSCWLPCSWANQCYLVHMTQDSTMTTTAPVLRNRSREWFSQQASGPLQINWRPRRDLLKSCQERLKDVGRASKCVRWFILCMSDGNECGPYQCWPRGLEEIWSKMHVSGMILDWWQPRFLVKNVDGSDKVLVWRQTVRWSITVEVTAPL